MRDTRLAADLGKDAVALIAVENIHSGFKDPWVAVEAQSHVLASAPRLLPQDKADVLRGEEVEVAVEIVVERHGTGGPSRVSETDHGRRINITALFAPVELIWPPRRQVEVWVAVLIIVGRSHPHAIGSAGRIGCAVHPRKSAPVVAKELIKGCAPPPLHVPAVDQVQVPISVIVVVEKGTASAIGLGQLLLRRGPVVVDEANA